MISDPQCSPTTKWGNIFQRIYVLFLQQSWRDFEAVAETLYVDFITHLYIYWSIKHHSSTPKCQKHTTMLLITTWWCLPPRPPALLVFQFPVCFSNGLGSPLLYGLDGALSSLECVCCTKKKKKKKGAPRECIPRRELNFRCLTLIIAVALRVLRRQQPCAEESDAALGVVGNVSPIHRVWHNGNGEEWKMFCF